MPDVPAARRPRILVVTGVFATQSGKPYLLDDLVDQLRADADVDVVVMDLNAPRARGLERGRLDGVRVWSVGPSQTVSGAPKRLGAYATSWWRLHTEVAPRLRRGSYDLALFHSPGVVTGGLPARLRRTGVARRLMFVMWDFFPVHHAEIGRVPSGLPELAFKAAERATIEACDVIAVMSPRNADFLRTYHNGLTAQTVILPPWAADAPDDQPMVKRDMFTVVFGGQLTRGRGVEVLIEAARILEDEGVPARIEVYGWGPHRDDLVALAAERQAGLISFHDPLPRDEYRRMLRSAHAGVAVTVPDVSVPTFPSKIVDYAQSSLAIIACLEEATDVGHLVVDRGAGVTCPAGDPSALAAAIAGLAVGEAASGAATAMGRDARALYEASLSAAAAARTVLSVAEGGRLMAAAGEGDQS